MQNLRNLMKQSRENGQKALFLRKKAKYFRETFFFHKKWATSLVYIHWKLTSCKRSEKSNDGKYENFCHRHRDRQTDGRTERQTDRQTVLVSKRLEASPKNPNQKPTQGRIKPKLDKLPDLKFEEIIMVATCEKLALDRRMNEGYRIIKECKKTSFKQKQTSTKVASKNVFS